MTQGDTPANAREAADRNANAVMTGNLSQVMADVTPEALQQLMGLGTSGGLTPQSMPSISGYEIEEQTDDAEGELFHVRFDSPAGSATLAARWKEVMGQWKITEVALVAAEESEG
jgi:hypothetical protein